MLDIMEIIIDTETREAIAESMADGLCQTIDEVRTMFGLSLKAAVKLFNDNEFLVTVSEYTKAKAHIFFHTVAMPKLMTIAKEGDDKSSMTAIKMVGQYSNNLNTKSKDVNVNISLEDRVLQSEKNITRQLAKPVEMKQIAGTDITSTEEVFDLHTLDLIPLNQQGEKFVNLWEAMEDDDD